MVTCGFAATPVQSQLRSLTDSGSVQAKARPRFLSANHLTAPALTRKWSARLRSSAHAREWLKNQNKADLNLSRALRERNGFRFNIICVSTHTRVFERWAAHRGAAESPSTRQSGCARGTSHMTAVNQQRAAALQWWVTQTAIHFMTSHSKISIATTSSNTVISSNIKQYHVL